MCYWILTIILTVFSFFLGMLVNDVSKNEPTEEPKKNDDDDSYGDTYVGY